jgi:putative transposase
VLNRAVGRSTVFEKVQDYAAFEKVLEEAGQRHPVRLLDFCMMPNHYQGRFKSFPVEKDDHFLTVCRYVERNALRADMVARAEQWRWSSLWHRVNKPRSVTL